MCVDWSQLLVYKTSTVISCSVLFCGSCWNWRWRSRQKPRIGNLKSCSQVWLFILSLCMYWRIHRKTKTLPLSFLSHYFSATSNNFLKILLVCEFFKAPRAHTLDSCVPSFVRSIHLFSLKYSNYIKITVDRECQKTTPRRQRFNATKSQHQASLKINIYLKGQYRHDQSSLSTGHGIGVLV